MTSRHVIIIKRSRLFTITNKIFPIFPEISHKKSKNPKGSIQRSTRPVRCKARRRFRDCLSASAVAGSAMSERRFSSSSQTRTDLGQFGPQRSPDTLPLPGMAGPDPKLPDSLPPDHRSGPATSRRGSGGTSPNRLLKESNGKSSSQ
jgi:hypothetical protein